MGRRSRTSCWASPSPSHSCMAGASAVGIGGLAFYGMRLDKESGLIEESEIWPQYVRDRLNSTFGYLTASIGLTAAAAFACSRIGKLVKMAPRRGSLGVLGRIFAILVPANITFSTPYENTVAKHFFWLLQLGVIGFVLRHALRNPVWIRYWMYTWGIVAGFSAVAMTAPSDRFLKEAGPLAMGLAMLFTASVRKLSLPKSSYSRRATVLTCCGLLFDYGFLDHVKEYVVMNAKEHREYGQTEGNDGLVFKSFDPINVQRTAFSISHMYSYVINKFDPQSARLHGWEVDQTPAVL